METYLLLVSVLVIVDLVKCDDVPNWNPETVQSRFWPHNKYLFPYRVQSPIDISLNKLQHRELPPLAIHFPWDLAEKVVSIENTGYYLEVLLPHDIKDRPFLTGGPLFQDRYIFEQMHFHWNKNNKCGSEHLLAGKCFPTEVHVVYYFEIYGSFEEASNHPDGVAVLTFFGQLTPDDSDNPNLRFLIQEFGKVIAPETKTKGSFDKEFKFLDILFKQTNYYTFPGSLTTPPFSECVTWIICDVPFGISSRQLDAFRNLRGKDGKNLRCNDRPLQEFSGRPVLTPKGTEKFRIVQDISYPNP